MNSRRLHCHGPTVREAQSSHMPPEEILKLTRQLPFGPFRIRLSNGTTYDVRHPEAVLVERRVLVVGVSGQNDAQAPFDRSDIISLVHIAQLERLPVAS